MNSSSPIEKLSQDATSATTRTSYEVIRETWLTRKPHPLSALVGAISTVLLALGAILYLADAGGAKTLMPASYDQVFVRGEYWRAWTTLFAHGDAGHLISNSFLFFVLGFFLYGHFGSRLFPLGALLFGGLINLSVLPSYPPQTHLIGMSGVVYWMGGAWLVLYFFLSRQKNMTHRLVRTMGVAILIFMPAETFDANVSYRTHFAGFAWGVAVGSAFYFWNRKRFLGAEVRETIFEDAEAGDSGDELPPPEGFPVLQKGTDVTH